MQNKILFLLIIFSFLSSCSNSIKEKDLTLISNSKHENTGHLDEGIQLNCSCFNGIGATKDDEPQLVVEFSNGKSVSICGFYDNEMQTEGLVMSEFNVFDCITGESYAEYDAVQTCRIISTKDSVILEELKYLPVGKNWTWEFIQIGEQVITLNNEQLRTTNLKPKLASILIDKKKQNEFLNSLKPGSGFGETWDDDIARLEVLSLLGNSKAWNILKNYEGFTKQLTDGAIAEQWKEAVANVEWIRSK